MIVFLKYLCDFDTEMVCRIIHILKCDNKLNKSRTTRQVLFDNDDDLKSLKQQMRNPDATKKN